MMDLDLFRLVLCMVFSLWGNVCDWKAYRLPNYLTVVFFAVGVCLGGMSGGVWGFLTSLAGAAVMLCLFPLFALRMLGAGDIKALMAIGAMLGLAAAPRALVYSILGAGAVAFLVVLFRKNGVARLRTFAAYCIGICRGTGIRPYAGALDAGGRFRFSFGITLGIAAMLVQKLM